MSSCPAVFLTISFSSPLWVQQYSKLFFTSPWHTGHRARSQTHHHNCLSEKWRQQHICSEPSTSIQSVSLHRSRKALIVWLFVLMRLRSAKRDLSSRRSTSAAQAFQLSDHYHCSIEAASLPGLPPVLSCRSSQCVSHSFLHLQDVDGILLRLPLHAAAGSLHFFLSEPARVSCKRTYTNCIM